MPSSPYLGSPTGGTTPREGYDPEASKATLTPSCTSCTPVVGDRVQSLGDQHLVWCEQHSGEYRDRANFLKCGETATLVEGADGNFPLQALSSAVVNGYSKNMMAPFRLHQIQTLAAQGAQTLREHNLCQQR